ncbi:MAG TPA: LON peptidase substrate-binding domain-containing protein [Candidatus Sulfotelmatobacter sp.]|nr:LON peptidase substrate-binding domain-containing protein [Candidatus Sulfotelmatobacter sp.]
MTRSPLETTYDDLPSELPIFPLSGVLLLPRGRLPLQIFEKRYLAMTRDALGAAQRLIGMIQPTEKETTQATNNPPVYKVGCAGRITSFSETDDGRFLVTLTGVCRFAVGEELPSVKGYRRVAPRWDGFARDFDDPTEVELDRARLLGGLKEYFRAHGISANWEAIEQAPDERLVTSLAMICPFEPSEKQALLEAADLQGCAQLMTTLIEMALLADKGGEPARH